MNKGNATKKELQQRVVVFLNREEVDFLDKIGKDALFTKGNKLSRTRIISCLVDLIKELDINGEGVSSLEELKKKIKHKIGATWPPTREILTYKEKENKPPIKEIENG